MKILVVEDEHIVAEDIRSNLTRLDYEVAVVHTGEDAVDAVVSATPDLAVLDIRLGGSIDGITAAGMIRNKADIPFIYLTAHSDRATFRRAALTAPHAFITKPFDFRNLEMAIELALNNFSKTSFAKAVEHDQEKPMRSDAEPYVFNNAVFIKVGKAFQKILLNEICYVKADGSYCVIHTQKRSFTVSMNLHTFLDRLVRPEFFRVHRSYVVNLCCVERVEEATIVVNEQRIPVSRPAREELLRRLGARGS